VTSTRQLTVSAYRLAGCLARQPGERAHREWCRPLVRQRHAVHQPRPGAAAPRTRQVSPRESRPPSSSECAGPQPAAGSSMLTAVDPDQGRVLPGQPRGSRTSLCGSRVSRRPASRNRAVVAGVRARGATAIEEARRRRRWPRRYARDSDAHAGQVGGTLPARSRPGRRRRCVAVRGRVERGSRLLPTRRSGV